MERELGQPSPPRHQPLVAVFAAVMLGVSADRFLDVSLLGWWLAVTGALLVWGGCVRWRCGRLAQASMLLAISACSGVWHHQHWRLFSTDDVGLCVAERPQPICVEVVALTSPRRIPAPPRDAFNSVGAKDESQLLVRFDRVREGAVWREAVGRTTLRVNGWLPGIEAGDRLRIFGLLAPLRPPLNPGEVDFAEFERMERRLCRLHVDAPACVIRLANGSRWQFSYWLNRVRDRCDADLWRFVGRPRAGLAAAVLLGAREQVDRQRNEDYMTTGTVHLLSISGLHLGILAYGSWIVARCGWLSRKKTLLLVFLFVVLYAALTESRPPVVRAAVLISVMCGAKWLGRQAISFNTLAASGLIVLAFNPTSFFQTGTQLSFLSVAVMVVLPFIAERYRVDDPLDRLVAASRPWPIRAARRMALEVGQALWLSTSIWLATQPLVAYRFHLVSPIATVLNPIVCLPMAVALFAGFGAMLLGWIAPPIAAACGVLCDVSLWCMEWSIAAALRCPGNHAWIPAPPAWWVALFYVGLTVAIARRAWRCRRAWMCSIAVAWLAVGAWFSIGPAGRKSTERNESLNCHFVAVGHGTSVLVEFPNGRTLVYDTGRMGPAITAARPISSVLWSRGISHLDAVLISHADSDHYNALPDLLERFSVGVVYVSPTFFRNMPKEVLALRRKIVDRNVPIRFLWLGRP